MKNYTLEEIAASWLGHGKQIPIGESMAWLIREVERLYAIQAEIDKANKPRTKAKG